LLAISLGSVSAAVAARRPAADARPKDVSGFRRVLVPLDGSKDAERALAYVDLLATTDAEIVLLRATPTPAALNRLAGVPAPGLIDLAATRNELCGEAAFYLGTVQRRLGERGLKATSSIAYGFAEEVISDRAREIGADLIVMTTHARGGLQRVVYGSVADTVVRHASCPVFLVPVRAGERVAVPQPPRSAQ
jgi:nucleotide-binding universal stress UspA family protein